MNGEMPKMPPASGWRTRYRSEPGMIGHYPWTYTDSELRTRRVDQQNYEVESLYTADQMRALAQEATRQAMERCITAIAACRPAEPNDVWEGAFQHVCDENIAAIRALSDAPKGQQ